eukprot:gene11234-19776_t
MSRVSGWIQHNGWKDRSRGGGITASVTTDMILS